MSTWLWIVGAVAVIWPLALFLYLDRFYTQAMARIIDSTAKAVGSQSSKISSFQQIAEDQERLIAALWAKVYGYYPSEDDQLIHSWTNYPFEAFGISPNWTLRTHEDDSPIEGQLNRNVDFPWG